MDKKLNIEELEKQCLEAEKNFKTLHDQLTKAKKEEEDTKQAKLAAERDARYQEVMDAKDKYRQLVSAFINDYGAIIIENNSDDWQFLDKPFRWWF
jgi:hypothetical protein